MPKKKCHDVDGAYFGCSFANILLMVYISPWRCIRIWCRSLFSQNLFPRSTGSKFMGERGQNTKRRKIKKSWLTTPKKNWRSWRTGTRRKRKKRKRCGGNIIELGWWDVFAIQYSLYLLISLFWNFNETAVSPTNNEYCWTHGYLILFFIIIKCCFSTPER